MSIYNKMSKKKKMKMLEFCKMNGIQTMPIKLEFKQKCNKITKKPVILSDGNPKMLKLLKCGSKMNWFKDEEDGHAKIKKRWEEYNNGNPKGYNHFAWDTGGIYKAIDIDCEVLPEVEGKTNPIKLLKDLLPYKRSTTKSFGRHLICELPEMTGKGDRIEFPEKYGVTNDGKKGIELLNGQWAWSHFDAYLSRVERAVKITKDLIDIQEVLTQKTQKTQKTQQKKEKNSKKTELKLMTVASKYKHLQDNLCNYCINCNPDDEIGKTTGVIHACHNSADESVYDLMLDILKQGKHHDGDEGWVRKIWKSSNEKTDKKYVGHWNKLNRKPKIEFHLQELEFTQVAAAEVMTKITKNDFIITPDEKDEGLYFWQETTKLWTPLKKDKCVIRRILRRIDEVKKIYINKFHELYPEEEDHPKELKQLFSTRSSQQAIGANTLDNIINEKPPIQVNFNQEPETKFLFQFKNGAYNFVTGKLEPRTREMHISECLPYDYRDIDEELQKKIDIVKRDFQRILQGECLEAHKKWRASCMLGMPTENFMLNLGIGGNGKSYSAETFQFAFKIYCDKPAKNLFDKNNDRALSKQFPKYFEKATRLIFMEEWSGNIDIELFKEVVGASEMDVVPLYKGSVTMPIIFNIEASTNKAPDLEYDPAANRRGLAQEFKSEFRPKGKAFSDQTYEVDEAKHHYRSDGTGSKTKFKNSEWALALFHYYRPEAEALSAKGGALEMPKYLSEAFEGTMKEGSKFTDFFDNCVIMEEAQTAYKKDVKKAVGCYFGSCDKKLDWTTINHEFKKRGYIYDCDKNTGNRSNGTFKKGAYINCIVNLQDAMQMLESEDEDELDYKYKD